MHPTLVDWEILGAGVPHLLSFFTTLESSSASVVFNSFQARTLLTCENLLVTYMYLEKYAIVGSTEDLTSLSRTDNSWSIEKFKGNIMNRKKS